MEGPVLRLATVNTASGRDLATGRVDTPALASAVAGLGADVVALQEVDRGLARSERADQAKVVARACGAPDARFAPAVLGTPGVDARPADAGDDGPAYGNAVLTALPVLRTDELRLGPSRARLPVPEPGGDRLRVRWFADEPRVALALVVGTALGPLSVVSTHLSFFPPHAVRQLRQVRAWAADLPRPLVLLGDLNLPAPAATWASGWTSLVAAPTFPAPSPRVQLDHALADGLSWPVSEAAAVRVGGSDHRGLVVTLADRRGRSAGPTRA